MKSLFILTLSFSLAHLCGSTVHAEFIHPGVTHSQSSIDLVKRKIAAGEEPWVTAWTQLKASRNANVTRNPQPYAHVERAEFTPTPFLRARCIDVFRSAGQPSGADSGGDPFEVRAVDTLRISVAASLEPKNSWPMKVKLDRLNALTICLCSTRRRTRTEKVKLAGRAQHRIKLPKSR